MKSHLIILLFFGTICSTYAQPKSIQRSGFYFYWGWNRAWYSTSDIALKGDNYDFKLDNVIAKDRQSGSWKTFLFEPTIPQYNTRVGYYFNEKYDISVGVDHMKYVVQNNQSVSISGYIEDSESIYGGVYNHSEIPLAPSLLRFEHTDGLNYIQLSLRRTDNLFQYKKLNIALIEGFTFGGLFPRTDSEVLGKERRDEFLLSGIGTNLMMGIQLGLGNNFFIMSEWKGGYINLPDIRTSLDRSDTGKQDFFFTQFNVVFGANIFGGHKK